MGFIRKVASISTLGLVDFRSDKERTASYTKAARKEAKKQSAIQEAMLTAMAQSSKQAPRPVELTPPPSWRPDPYGRHEHRWWDGSGWTENVSDAGVTGTDPS